jgi:hypothetical protein
MHNPFIRVPRYYNISQQRLPTRIAIKLVPTRSNSGYKAINTAYLTTIATPPKALYGGHVKSQNPTIFNPLGSEPEQSAPYTPNPRRFHQADTQAPLVARDCVSSSHHHSLLQFVMW